MRLPSIACSWSVAALVLLAVGAGCGSVGTKSDAAAGAGGAGGAGGVGGGSGGGDAAVDLIAHDAGGDTGPLGDGGGFTIGGDIMNLGGRVVLRNNGGDDLVVAADGSFSFATALPAGASYAVSVSMQPTSPPQTCTVMNGSGMVGSANVTSVHVTCAYPTSCADLHTSAPVYGDGMYTIDPDGTGAIFPVSVYCDMTFGGGGWTLIHATTPNNPPNSMTAGTVTAGSGAYMPTLTMQALAAISHQIHIRSPGDPTNRSITSVNDSIALANLKNAMILNFGLPTDNTAAQLAPWTGPFAVAGTLSFNCTPSGAYPALYWACGNNTGFHIVGTNTTWNFSTANEEIDTYLR